MSAIGVSEDEYIGRGSGCASTADIYLAAIAGGLGFELRRSQPVALVCNGAQLVRAITNKSAIDRETGALDEVANVQMFFETPAHTPWGKIPFDALSLVFGLVKVRHELQTKGPDPKRQHTEAKAHLACQKREIPDSFILHVQGMYDALCNVFVLSACIEMLARDPFISFTRQLAAGKVGHAIQPVNHDGGVMKQAEKLMRGESFMHKS